MFRDILSSFKLILIICVFRVKPNDDCIFVGCECGKYLFDDYVICKPTDTLPSNTFPDRNPDVMKTNYDLISFENFELKNLPSRPLFAELNVRRMTFINNSIEKLYKENFQNMTSLQTLDIKERKLNEIEPMTFAPIAGSLKELRLNDGGYSFDKIVQFNENIRLLTNLKKLNLSNNMIESIDDTILSELKNLDEVDLSDNVISNVAADTFLNNHFLRGLNLKKNRISHLNNLFEALENSRFLDYLELGSNNIENLPDFPNSLNRTISLGLSENKLRTINQETFRNLSSLSYLLLDNNYIESIHEKAFEFTQRLLVLILRNNRLSGVPVIRNLRTIYYIDLRDQNGYLKEIQDYSFQRDPRYLSFIRTDLSGNDVKMGKKAFCVDKQEYSYILKLTVSYKTFHDMNICSIRQLQADYPVPAEIDFTATDSDLTACNCDLKSYFDFYNVVFPVNCNLTAECTKNVTEDVCWDQDEYSCPSFKLHQRSSASTIVSITFFTTINSPKSLIAIFLLNVSIFLITK